jgi:hypothetical protein
MTVGVALFVALSGLLPQPVVLGPFPLGDLILADPKDNWLVTDFTAAGLDLDDVRKQMNGWKMFVVDHKVRGDDGAWRWFRPGRGWGAEAMVTGRLSIEVKDKRGKKVEIVLTECKAIAVTTYTTGDGKGGPPFVACDRHVTLRFHNLAVPITEGIFAGGISFPKEGGQDLSRIRYDINGKITPVEKR